MLATFAFYMFATIMLLSAIMVVAARNPVHAVLFLILSFFNAGGLFVLLGAEFVAMVLIIVYVGAVAVLFLFVVMMLNVDAQQKMPPVRKYLPVAGLVGIVLFTQLALAVTTYNVAPDALQVEKLLPTPATADMTNTHALAQVLYTRYAYIFQGCGLVLLVAMIGAIVLTLRQRENGAAPLRQNVNSQIERRPDEALALKNAKSGEGIEL